MSHLPYQRIHLPYQILQKCILLPYQYGTSTNLKWLRYGPDKLSISYLAAAIIRQFNELMFHLLGSIKLLCQISALTSTRVCIEFELGSGCDKIYIVLILTV